MPIKMELFAALAAVGLLVVVVLFTWNTAINKERHAWELVIAKQQAEADMLLQAAKDRAAAAEARAEADKREMEQAYEARIAGLRQTTSELHDRIAAAGGLYDVEGRREGGGGAGGGVSGTPSDTTGAPAGCRLSEATSQRLLDLAASADAAAAYALTAHQYAVKMQELHDEQKKAAAAD